MPGPSVSTTPCTSDGRAPASSSATYAPSPRPSTVQASQVGQGRVGVGHQQLDGVAAAPRHRRPAVPGEVEAPHRPRPVGGRRGHDRQGALAEAVQEQQGPGGGVAGPGRLADEVQGQLDAVVAQRHGGRRRDRVVVGATRAPHRVGRHLHGRGVDRVHRPVEVEGAAAALGGGLRLAHDRNSSTRSAMRRGCSMCTKWPTPSRGTKRAPAGRYGHDVLGERAPAHDLALEPQHPEHGHAEPGQPHHRPLGAPRAEAAQAQARVDLPAPAVVGLPGPDRHEVAQPLGRQPGVHAAAALGEGLDGAGLADGVGGAAPVVEPRGELTGEQPGAVVLGDVGPAAARRQAVEVDEVAHAVRERVGHVEQQAPALGVAEHGDGLAPDRVEHRQGVALVGLPAVQLGVVGVAVAALVPAHDAPPAVGHQGGERVVGAGEVEAAVGEQDRRGALVAPLVHGQAQAVRVDRAGAVGTACSGERRPRRGGLRHGRRRHHGRRLGRCLTAGSSLLPRPGPAAPSADRVGLTGASG